MPNVINPALIGNWENWLRVFLMFSIGAAVVNLAFRRNSQKG